MGLITKTVIIKWNAKNKQYFESKNYIYTKIGDEFEVKVEDLSISNKVKVNVECDGCGEKLKPMVWDNYITHVKEDGKYYCQKCAKNGYKKYISFYDWCYENLSKEEADKIMDRWDYGKNVDEDGNKINPKNIYYSSSGFNKKGYWFKCLSHPEHGSELKNISNFTKGHKGSINCNKCNSISITNPELEIFLVNKEDALKYSRGERTLVLMKCPKCGFKKTMTINDLKKHGFSCSRCSDSIPYPEKFMFNALEQLNINFTPQLTKITLKWVNNYKYDFYIPSINCIIETHGKQHYEESTGSWHNLKVVQKNDKHKEILAKNNNIINYIIIDCRESNLDWIRNSIMNSDLPKLLNFKEDDINWLECHEFACNSLIKIACDYWNNEYKNTNDIGKIMKLNRNTITKYLKQGAKLGWCDYDPKKEIKYNLNMIHNNKYKQVICISTGEIFNSQKDVKDKYNIIVSACCRGKTKSAGKHPETGEPLKWMYYNDYEKLNKVS